MNKLPLVMTALFAAGILSAPAAMSKNFYKWVDESGATHYSERKPTGQEAETVAIRGGRTTAADEESSATPEATTEATREAAPQVPPQAAAPLPDLKDPERCQAARENMQTLSTYARIRVQGDDGEMRYLTPEEKQEKMTESQNAVNEAC